MTVVNDKIGMFGADLSVADLSAFELELIVNNPTGGFLFTPNFLTNI